MADKGGVGKAISMQDWEQIMQDFRTSAELQEKWLIVWPGLTLVEQALIIILKKEISMSIRCQLLIFMEENAAVLIGAEVMLGFGMILESLRGVLQPLNDGANSLRENMMVMATAAAIVTDALHNAREKLEGLVELFLVYINRPNHPSDRQVRGLACDCLRELEMAYPCLLYGCVGHIRFLCVNEKTHANQSYTLLLTTIVENLSTRMYTIRSKSANYLPILQNTAPLVPFSVPFFLVSSTPGKETQSLPARELTPGNLREFRTVVAFLLERPQLLTTVGMLELVSSVIRISKALDLPGSSLKTHFSGLLHSYSPILCHIVLLIYTHFMESMDGDEGAILKRLIALVKDDSQLLPFRLLGVHWLLGVEALHARKHNPSVLAPFASGLYPLVFDPLSLKAAKLGALAHCAISLDQQGRASQGNGIETNGSVDPASVLLNDGLLSISSFNWLPPWSTETQLAFHIFHRFLTVAIPHSRSKANTSDQVGFGDSPLFQTLQKIFVTMAVQKRKLVPSLVALLDRLMGCDVHRALGERLLRTFNEELLPQLQPNHHLPSYFPLLERIAENKEMPPSGMIETVTAYIRQRVEEQVDGDEEWVLWSRSTQVLGICRTVLLHHQTSRVFHVLAPLLAFLCRFSQDIEVRDSARLYLRLLISIPGNKLRDILKYGDERVDEANAPQVSSLLQSSYLSSTGVHKPSLPVASYIQLTRITPLLVRHSWSLVLFDYFKSSGGAPYEFGNRAPRKEMKEDAVKENVVTESSASHDEVSSSVPVLSKPALRVMDTKTSEVIRLLRRHFAEIPGSMNGAGLKIKVPCTLRFLGEYYQKLLGEAESESGESSTLVSSFSSVTESWPAIYAVVITFKTSGFYGPIPNVRVPFLLSEPPEKWQGPAKSPGANSNENPEVKERDQKGKGKFYSEDWSQGTESFTDELDNDTSMVPLDSAGEDEQVFSELVVVELEPKKPVPTLVDIHIVFSDNEGQGVEGQLDAIPISIEDLFMKPLVPADLSGSQTDYMVELFNALWEACSGPGMLGTETFALKGAFEMVSIHGSESVKLLEAQADRVVAAVEHYLAHFVVAISGGPLAAMTNHAGAFQDAKWLGEEIVSSGSSVGSGPHLGSPLSKSLSSDSSLQIQVRDPGLGSTDEVRSGLGRFLVLVLLPPRYHLLMRMEVADESTLVRIRTDHWPCLAHVDEYLEALTH